MSVCLSVSLFKSCMVLAVTSRELVCGGFLSVCFSVQIMCGLGCSVKGISAVSVSLSVSLFKSCVVLAVRSREFVQWMSICLSLLVFKSCVVLAVVLRELVQ